MYGLDNRHFSTSQYIRDIQNPLKLVYNIEPLVQPFRERASGMILHGLESNPGSSQQTYEEAGLP